MAVSRQAAEGKEPNKVLKQMSWVFRTAQVLILLSTLSWLASRLALAHEITPHTPQEVLSLIGFDQRLDASVPQDLYFHNEVGNMIRFGELFEQGPVILALGYFECPNLCSLVRMGLVHALREVRFNAGEQFKVVMVSIDPSESPALAAKAKEEAIAIYGRPETAGGWHFLTGDHETIDLLAEAVGFRYVYDTNQAQYAHASGLVILTPQGKVARYLLGLEYAPRDLRLGLVEAAQNRIGSAVDQILLFCLHYNPVTGRYTMAVLTALRLAGTVFVLAMAVTIWRLSRSQSNETTTSI